MSEVDLRFRLGVVKATPRKVPVTTLTGFTVEHTTSTITKTKGILIFDDEGFLVDIVPKDSTVVYCPHCGGNFPVYSEAKVNFCGWCGARLEGDE